jgi:hypothetical protein
MALVVKIDMGLTSVGMEIETGWIDKIKALIIGLFLHLLLEKSIEAQLSASP